MNLLTSKKFSPRLIKIAFVVVFLIAVSFIMGLGQTGLSVSSSSELGFASLSPSGASGGAIIPASCESGYEHYSGECSPKADIKANGSDGPITVNYGSNVRVTWTSSNVSVCTVFFSDAGGSWSGTSGDQTHPLYVNRTYDQQCSGPAGTARDMVTVNVSPPFNYTLSNSGTSFVTKTSGNAFTQNTITKTLIAGGTESVSLSLSGVPTGTSYSISNSACSPTCSSVITFTVGPSTSVGTRLITVTGSPLSKQTSFNLVVSGNPMTISCSASPTTALISETVTWTANVSGGTPPLSYSWSGTNIPTSPAPNTNPFSISYSTLGQKTAAVTVTDADSVQATCPASVVQINFNPSFEEF